MLFPIGSLPDGPSLETQKAILLLDFQNDFVHCNGKLASPNTSAFLPRLIELVSRFRGSGEVVWVRTEYRNPCSIFSPDTGGCSVLLKQFAKQVGQYNDDESGYATPRTDCDGSQALSEPVIELDPEAFLAADLPDGYQRCCVPNSWGSEYPKLVESAIDRRKDFVVVKSQYSAFADMSLLMQLRTRTVTDLYICGSMSNISVYATVLDAVRHGFGVTLIEDCLGYRDDDCHLQAMRQMADSMCAEGIDHQELIDELAGILGDVIKEEQYTTRYQVDLSRPQPSAQARSYHQQVNDWISAIEPKLQSVQSVQSVSKSNESAAKTRPASSGSEQANESSLDKTLRQRSCTIESSPPRKRSTNDLEELEEAPATKPKSYIRRASHEPCSSRTDTRGKKIKSRVRRAIKEKQDEPTKPQSPGMVHSYSTGDISDDLPSPVTVNGLEATTAATQEEAFPMSNETTRKGALVFLGPKDHIGDGTSKVIYDVVDDAFAEQAFEILQTNVAWQKMYHRTGEVPRLVAVQGDVVTSSVDNSRTFPVYRHPADESPELSPFDATVEMLRQTCEQHVGHTLNHVLIQHYRNSEDNISEHSDKSLDIVKGSNIVNLSLGAQRTMLLRSKKTELFVGSVESPASAAGNDVVPRSSRETQRIPLPHNSLFILSPSTNTKYLHSIRADKRPTGEKLPEELAFEGERISLTFRHIGTYLTEYPNAKQLIWGQGAKGKTRQAAGPVLSGDKEAEMQGEEMIIAFGKENHEGASFDWAQTYGSGFDVLNFVVKPPEE